MQIICILLLLLLFLRVIRKPRFLNSNYIPGPVLGMPGNIIQQSHI